MRKVNENKLYYNFIMSSAVAMNRKIAQQSNASHNVSSEVQQMQRGGGRQNRQGRPQAGLRGTPIQQCWQVLNFHEKRLNDVGGFLAKTSQETTAHFAAVAKREELLEHKVKQLEAQIAAILPHLQKEATDAVTNAAAAVSHAEGTSTAKTGTKRRGKNNTSSIRLEVTDR